jgi:aspartyl-tRNA synthetase
MTSLALRANPGVPTASRVQVCECNSRIGETVVVHGWIAGVRRTNSILFLSASDRTGAIQIVCKDPTLLAQSDTLTCNSAVRVNGLVRIGRAGTAEIEAVELIVLARAEATDPRPGPDVAAPHALRFLDQRGSRQQLICSVRTTLLRSLRDALLDDGFLEIQTPKISAAGSESGAAVFELKFFGRPAYLAQSPQFYMQTAMAAGLERAFEIGPVFRAEPSDTNRHAAEFSCLDVELSWIESHHELMDLEESLIRGALDHIADRHGDAIERQFGVPVERLTAPIPRVPYAEALRIVERSRSAGPTTGRITFSDEQVLCKALRRQSGASFVFVTEFPAEERPFYTMAGVDGDRSSRSFDLLWRGIEITSGCQREHNYATLLSQISAADVAEEARSAYLVPYYLPLFKHGCPPHGGFGLGIERFLFTLLGCSSIAETSFVYRGPERLTP